MARSGRGDVELIISARNQATEEIQELIDRLEELSNAADGRRSGGLFDSLTRSTQDFAARQEELTQALQAAQAAQRNLNTSNNQREADLTSYQDEVDKTRARLEQLSRQYEEYAAAVALPRRPSDALLRTMEQQTARQQELSNSVRETTTELSRAQGELSQNAGIDARAQTAIDEYRQNVIELGQAWREATQAVAAGQRELAQRSQVADTDNGAATAAKQRLELLRQERDAQKAAFTERRREIAEGGRATAEQKADLDERRANIDRLRTSIQEQTTAERELRAAARASTTDRNAQQRSVDRQIEQARRQRTAYQEASQAAREFEQAQATAGTERQQASIARLNSQLETLQRQYTETGARIEATNSRLASASAVSSRDVAAYERLRQQIEETNQSLQEQETALEAQRAAYDRAGASTDDFQRETEQLDEAIDRLTREQNELGEAARGAGVDINRAGDAARRTGREFRIWGNDSRQALSLLQRIRGELLAIGAAYVGVFAIGGAIRSIYDSSVLTQKATSRLSSVLGGDLVAVGEELEYVERTADKFGLEVDNLKDQYSQFAAAVPRGRLSLEQLRFTFEGVATAAVATGASTDDVQGTFKALTQIVSKGSLQLEELTGQLAERIPGALQATVDGLNKLGDEVITVEELLKRINNGQVSGDVIVAIAQGLKDQFGPSLEVALQSPVVALNRFQNQLSAIRRELANSGFIEKLTDGLRQVTAQLRTPEAREGIQKIADALIAAVDTAVFFVQNIDKVVEAVKQFLVLKFAGYVISMSVAIVSTTVQLRAFVVQLLASSAAARGLLATLSALRGVLLVAAAAYGGFKLGEYLNEQYVEVQVAGARIVEVVEIAGKRIGQIMAVIGATFSSGITAGLKLAARKVLGFVSDLFDETLSIIASAFDYLDDDVAASIRNTQKNLQGGEGSIAESLIKKYNLGATDFTEKVKSINEAAEADIAQVRVNIEDQIDAIYDAFDRKKEGSLLSLDGNQIAGEVEIALDDIKAGLDFYKTGSNAGQSLSAGLIDQLRTIEDTLENESADTLEKRLALIRKEFEEFQKGVSSFQDQGDEAVSEIKKRTAIEIARIEAKAGIDAESKATTIAALQIKTQAEIAAIQQQQASLSGARSAVQQLVEVRSEKLKQEDQDRRIEESQERVNNLITDQKDAVAALTEQRDLRLIDEDTYQAKLRETNQLAVSGIREAVEEARKLAKATGDASLQKFVDGFDNFEKLATARTQVEKLAQLEREINDALTLRNIKLDTINLKRENGAIDAATAELETKRVLEESNAVIEDMLLNAYRLAQNLGDVELAEKLKKQAQELKEVNKGLFTGAQLSQDFASGATNAFDEFISGTKSAGEAFRSFIADFLKQIALAIIQQLILNAISGGAGGGAGGAFAGALNSVVPTNHTGGIVGRDGKMRSVNPAVFANAIRYHSGGVAGLKPNEVPTILERGEEVLTRSDPRNVQNGGTSGSGQPITINNMIDSPSVLEAALSTSQGSKAILNYIRANKSATKAALA